MSARPETTVCIEVGGWAESTGRVDFPIAASTLMLLTNGTGGLEGRGRGQGDCMHDSIGRI